MKNNHGFTLIETFGAITILILAVIGPLALLSRNLADASLIKSQMTATYLAQEAIELVINHRDLYTEDAKIFQAGNLNKWLGGLVNSCVGTRYGCNLDLPDNLGNIVAKSCLAVDLPNNPCQLVLVGDDGVNFYRPGDTNAPNPLPTVFKRSIFIVPFNSIDLVTGEPDNGIISSYFWTNEGAKVTVVIDYSFRGRPKKYVLSTIIYNQSVDGVHQDSGSVEF